MIWVSCLLRISRSLLGLLSVMCNGCLILLVICCLWCRLSLGVFCLIVRRWMLCIWCVWLCSWWVCMCSVRGLSWWLRCLMGFFLLLWILVVWGR